MRKNLCPCFPGFFRLGQTVSAQRGQKFAPYLPYDDYGTGRLLLPACYASEGVWGQEVVGKRGYQHPLGGRGLAGAHKRILRLPQKGEHLRSTGGQEFDPLDCLL